MSVQSLTFRNAQVHIVYSLNGNRNSLFGASVMNFADNSIVAVILPFSKDLTFCEIQEHF
jgi:hypothetical protein